MNSIIEFIKGCWKGVLTVVGVIAVVITLNSFYSSLATSADLKQMKEEVKQYAAQSVMELKKTMDLDRDISRLDSITDSLIKARLQQRTYPKDQSIKDDVDALTMEKEKIKQRIDKR